MRKKLIISAVSVGVFILLTVIITGLIFVYRNNTDRVSVNKEQSNISSNTTVREISASFRENNFDEALLSVDNLLVDNPNNVEVLLLKADILLAKGSVEFKENEFASKARVILQRVLLLDDKNVKAFRLMGYSYEIQNMFQEALVNYNKSLGIKETADTYNWKGHTYDLMGNIQKAEEFYKKALSLDSNNEMALRNLSRVYLRLGKKDDARKILEKLIEMPVSNIGLAAGDYHSLGTIEFDNKNIDRAISLFREALEIDPSCMLAQIEIAKYKILFEGEKEEAISMLNEIVNNYPKQVAPLEWLGFAYLENDEFSKSIETLNNAKSLIAEDITLMGEQKILIRSRLNYYLSMAYALNGDEENAKKYLLKIMEGTDETIITMLVVSLEEGVKGPYGNIMSDPEIANLASELNKINKL